MKEDFCSFSKESISGVDLSEICKRHDFQYADRVKNRKTRKQADLDFKKETYLAFKYSGKSFLGLIVSNYRYFFVRLFAWVRWIK